MKHIYTLLVLLLFLQYGTLAQKPITVTDDSLKFGSSSIPGFSVIIPEVEYEKTMKNWVKELQSGTKSKVVEKGDELSIFGAKVKAVSDDPVNVYSSLKDQDDGLNLQVAMELEKDRYIGNAERSGAREFLFEFAKNEYLALAKDQLEAEERKLRNLENELASLEREQSRMEKSIQSNNQTISEEEARLNALNAELDYISDTSQPNPPVAGMGSRDEDEMKDLEKKRKKTTREIRSSEKKIDQAEIKISSNKRELPENAREQELARRRISEQEAVVQKYEEKFDEIKKSRL